MWVCYGSGHATKVEVLCGNLHLLTLAKFEITDVF